jgi:hypothetical protein
MFLINTNRFANSPQNRPLVGKSKKPPTIPVCNESTFEQTEHNL